MNFVIRIIFFAFIIMANIIFEALNSRDVRRGFRNFLTNRRRNRYVKTHRNFVKKVGDSYKLFNKNVACEYSLSTLVFKIDNLRNPDMSAKARMNLKYTDTRDCVMVLDSILFAFDENSNFEGIVSALNASTYFLVDITNKNKQKQTLEKTKIPKSKEKFKEIEKQYDEKININKASEEEIAKLPGVSIIKAKKIVQYRILHNGFKTMKEFLKVADVKPHFLEGISEMTFLGRFQNNEDKTNERIIDI